MLFDFLISLFGMILTIFIVVGFHEGAHFLMARLLGIKVLEFSIGFGKTLYRWRDRKGTEYVFALIPLGGFVRLLDETEGKVAASERHLAFNRQPLYKRMAIVAAGPFSNLVMAVLFCWIIYVLGFKTPIPIIGAVEAHSIASEAGLKPQQEIVSVDGHSMESWPAISMRLVMHTGDTDSLTMGVKPFHATGRETENIQIHSLNLETWQMNSLKPDPLSSLGITPYEPEVPLIIGKIKPGSPAEASPLQLGDKIIALDGKHIMNWDGVLETINKKPNQTILFTISRHHQKLKLPVTLGYHRDLLFHKRGFLGIGPDFIFPENLVQKIQYGPIEAVSYAFKEVVELSYLNILLLGKLVTNKLSILSLGGPITIFESAGSAFQYGILPFLSFLAFLNVALGVINFLPIPGLDGGHLLFQIIEAIIQRPISLRVQMFFHRMGFLFLIIVLIQALTNDLLRLWS